MHIETVVKEDGKVWGVAIDLSQFVDVRPGSVFFQRRLFAIEIDDAIEASLA